MKLVNLYLDEDVVATINEIAKQSIEKLTNKEAPKKGLFASVTRALLNAYCLGKVDVDYDKLLEDYSIANKKGRSKL